MRRKYVGVAAVVGGSLLAGGALGVAALGPHFAFAPSSTAPQIREATFVSDPDPADDGVPPPGRARHNCPHGSDGGAGAAAPDVAPQAY